VPVDALALPLLVVTAIGVLGYALMLRRLAGVPGTRAGWIVVAAIVLATLAALPLLGARAGFVGFILYNLLIVAPFVLRQRMQRAYVAGDEKRAMRLARVLSIIQPTQPVRDEVAALPSLIALRAGDELPPAELDRLAHGHEPLRRAYDVIVLHNRRDVDGVLAAFAEPEQRAALLAQGLGPVYVQAVGCTTSDGDALASALAVSLAGDPSLRGPERGARSIVQAHALAGDVAATEALVGALCMYLERGDKPVLLALARWCAGDLAAARDTIAAGLSGCADHRFACSALTSLRDMFDRRGPRPAMVRTPALQRRLEHMRRDVPVLRAISVFVGRAAVRPRVTLAWMAVLAAVYVAFAWSGDPLSLAHIYAWGGLPTDILAPHAAWRALAELPLDAFTPLAVVRLATSTLIHAGSLHLLLNLLMLWMFGGFVEALYGRARLIAVYVLGGVLSGVAVVLLTDPASPLVLLGASGAIMALGGAVLAALLVRRDLRQTPIGRSRMVMLLILFGLQVVFDAFTPEVSGSAHASGLVAGFLLGALLTPRPPPLFPASANMPLEACPQRPAP
jgi:membrane associated rhomboid family serine protease